MDPVVETRATYDAIAEAYAAAHDGPQRRADAVADYAARVSPGSIVLDVGCGPGHETALLRDAGLRAFGLDLSVGMLRAGVMAGRVAQADMRALPIQSESVDGIWCQAAMLHVPRADVPGVLYEFARVTRPGGWLQLSLAEGDGVTREPQAYGADRARWYVHHRENPLRTDLNRAGWQVTEVERAATHRIWLTLVAQRT